MAIKVLIVDDSAAERQMLSAALAGDPEITVVGTAADPYDAREKIKLLKPDVLTLDVELPRMDGLTFIENLMRLHPMPVVMVSSLTEAGAQVTLDALERGAVDFVTKPKPGSLAGPRFNVDELRAKVKAAAHVKLPMFRPRSGISDAYRNGQHESWRASDCVIAIGASAGGTEALRTILAQMPADGPAIVITQHIPAEYSFAFAARMDRLCAMSVCEAQDGQEIVPGTVYVAPGGRHLKVVRFGAHRHCRLSDEEPVSRHRPSVDVMFRSLLQSAGRNTTAALLTGMGDDGARGLLELRAAGVHTIAQDQASSLVWGMPGAAVRMDAASQVLALEHIAQGLLSAASAAQDMRIAADSG